MMSSSDQSIPCSSMATVTITEHPAQINRFRYESEIEKPRFLTSLLGASSNNKCYPTIRVDGYHGPYGVLLSLINSENDYVHPHAVKGNDPRYTCTNGTVFVISETPEVVFNNICIVCVKEKTQKDVTEALLNRQAMGVDPFGAGYPHITNHSLIDFTAVRLCFQVILPNHNWTEAGMYDPMNYSTPLEPVASTVVYDAKKYDGLKIHHISSCAGPLSGGTEINLWCEKKFATGNNPEVIFDDKRGWTQKVKVTEYHKQLVMRFNAPPYPNYKDCNCTDKIEVYVHLEQSTKRGILSSLPAVVAYLPNKEEKHPPSAGKNKEKTEPRKRSRDNLDIVDSSAIPGTPRQAQREPPSSDQLPVNYDDISNNGLSSNNSNNSSNENTPQSAQPSGRNLVYISAPFANQCLHYTNSQKSGQAGPVEWNVQKTPTDANDVETMSVSTLNTSSILSEILDIEMEGKLHATGHVNLANDNLSERTIRIPTPNIPAFGDPDFILFPISD